MTRLTAAPSAPADLSGGVLAPAPATAAARRHLLILKVLSEQGVCRVSDMARRFGLSEMTLRRDLQEMHEAGLLRRVHGGALPANTDTAFGKRTEQGLSQKQQIGRAAVGLLRNGWSIYLDAGTTAMEVARALRDGVDGVTQLAVVTNGVNIAAELAGRTPYELHAIGGAIYDAGLSAVGPITLAQLASFHFDLFFMGARGVDPQAGWTNTNHLETQVKHAVMARSRRVCAVVDSQKWAQRALITVAPFEAVTHWVSDAGLPAEARDAARAHGIALTLSAPA